MLGQVTLPTLSLHEWLGQHPHDGDKQHSHDPQHNQWLLLSPLSVFPITRRAADHLSHSRPTPGIRGATAGALQKCRGEGTPAESAGASMGAHIPLLPGALKGPGGEGHHM